MRITPLNSSFAKLSWNIPDSGNTILGTRLSSIALICKDFACFTACQNPYAIESCRFHFEVVAELMVYSLKVFDDFTVYHLPGKMAVETVQKYLEAYDATIPLLEGSRRCCLT